MQKVSAKRQITIPIGQCLQAGIEPGDEIETSIHKGLITIIKKTNGAAEGMLSHIESDHRLSDEESLHSVLDERNKDVS